MSDVNKEAITEWVAALRSGDYTQGTGQLARVHDDGSIEYCCLGVACELNAERLKLNREVGFTFRRVLFSGDYTVLPLDVMNHLGFEAPNPEVHHGGDMVSLAELNDDHGLSFNEIADLIEDTFLGGE